MTGWSTGTKTLTLFYWQPGMPFRVAHRSAVSLALEKAREAPVILSCEPNEATRRRLREFDTDRPLICTTRIAPLDSGGAEQLIRLIREHQVSVLIIDKLRRLEPWMHWTTPGEELDRADREVLRGLRRLISAFDRPIEVVLFHLIDRDKAEQLLGEGLVDELGEVRS